MSNGTLCAALVAIAWLAGGTLAAVNDYTLGPDSQVQPGVPRGVVTEHTWQSTIFPGTARKYWVYVPAQYDGSSPAAVMVFQDGGNYVKADGSWRVPVVFDNLIHKKEMPVTIGVFVDPGVVAPASADAQPRFNRSFEYDSVTDRYARFLLEEILPEVGKRYRLSTDAGGRAIGGASSGGVAAFTVAWQRPDAFSRVFSTIGTYVSLRGGHNYPMLVRKTEPKPLRVFLQDGSGDLDIYAGNWWVANQDMLSALEFAGYDVTHVWGDGGHDSKHGSAILPEAMRWLWRDYPQPVRAAGSSKQPLVNAVLAPGEDWQLVGEGYRFTEGPTTAPNGEVFFSDVAADTIQRVGLDGRITVFKDRTGGADGMEFGPEGRLYAALNKRRQIVAYDRNGVESLIASDISPNDLVVGRTGTVYVTDPEHKQVWHITPDGRKTVVDTGIGFPNGITMSADQTLLFVADSAGAVVYSFSIQPDGSLANKEPFFHLHVAEGAGRSGADGLTVDDRGNLYVATDLGIQVCDQLGRVNGIIAKPAPRIANLAFGGPGRDELYVNAADKVYKRKLRTKGVSASGAPVKPPTPRL
jgi:sugar lactone lactonase YvrE/enterochelin esterase-like enzyme